MDRTKDTVTVLCGGRGCFHVEANGRVELTIALPDEPEHALALAQARGYALAMGMSRTGFTTLLHATGRVCHVERMNEVPF